MGGRTTDINFELDNDDSSSIIVDDDNCSHVLTFDQKESGSHGQLDNGMIIRSFLHKRINDNGNLKVLNDLYFSVVDENLSSRQRYINSLLHTSVCILHDCIHGTLFPYELVHWPASKIAYLECLTISRVDTSSTWLWATTEDHWSTQYIYDKLGQQ